MKKKCTFADKYQGIQPPKCGPGKRGCEACWKKWDEMHPLSDKFKKELNDTIKEMDDPTRYVVVSSLLDTFNLFYNVESNCYAGSFKKNVIPDHCTVFKDIKIAKAVRLTLHEGKKRKKDLEIWKVIKNKKTKKLKFVEKV